MRNDAPLAAPPFDPPGLLVEAGEGVKGAAGLEGADALEVLALEPDADLGVRGGPLLPCLLLRSRFLLAHTNPASSGIGAATRIPFSAPSTPANARAM